MEIALSLFAILTGIIIGVFLFSPFYAFASADAYQLRKEKWLIIFTRRRPNRLMQRLKGTNPSGTPIDYIGIVPPGIMFRGETNLGAAEGLTKNNPQYWELIRDVPGGQAATWYENHRSWFVRFWLWYLNLFSDVALVGLRGLYDIYEYEIEKIRYHKKTGIDRDTGEKKIEYEITPPNPKETSNHVRISPFPWAVTIIGAETHDRVSWSMLVVVNLRCINPWMTLHNYENWSQFVTTAVVDALVRKLRTLDIDGVMKLVKQKDEEGAVSLSFEQRDMLVMGVREIEPRLKSVIGLEIDDASDIDQPGYSGGVQILSIEPNFRTQEDREAFTEVWRAGQKAASERTLGDAEAYRESTVVNAVAEAVERHGEAGMHVQRMQAMENAAKSGKSTLIFDSGGGSGGSNIEKLLALLVAEKQDEANRRNQQ